MLSLANLQSVPVQGDGNCGFYEYLASQGKLEHSIGMPSVADYNAQQQLRAKCVRWLQNEGSGTAAYVFGTEKNNPLSSWSPANIERLLLGKDGPRERTGVYANEPALRAMAAIG